MICGTRRAICFAERQRRMDGSLVTMRKRVAAVGSRSPRQNRQKPPLRARRRKQRQRRPRNRRSPWRGGNQAIRRLRSRERAERRLKCSRRGRTRPRSTGSSKASSCRSPKWRPRSWTRTARSRSSGSRRTAPTRSSESSRTAPRRAALSRTERSRPHLFGKAERLKNLHRLPRPASRPSR